MVVCEGGSLYHMDMSMVADGNTSIEHNVPPERFYDDVLQFWPPTKVAYTPTLVVTYSGPGSEHFFYQESEVWAHPILSRYVPPQILQPRSVRRQMAPASDYQPYRDSAANAKRLMDSDCGHTGAQASAKARDSTGKSGQSTGRYVGRAGLAGGKTSARISAWRASRSIDNGKARDWW